MAYQLWYPCRLDSIRATVLRLREFHRTAIPSFATFVGPILLWTWALDGANTVKSSSPIARTTVATAGPVSFNSTVSAPERWLC